MKENIVIVNFKSSSDACQALNLLRAKPDNEGFFVSHGAIVKMDGGKLALQDGFVADDVKGEQKWTGGLIGGLVGLLAGPVGALVGGIGGALVGKSLDEDDLEDVSELLQKAGECLVNGETALLLKVQEDDETALEDKMRNYKATITRLDAEQVEAEIEQAEN